MAEVADMTNDNEWWRGATIYQIYPRSFADANGDGIGDLAGITGRLDYVASLGVDGIWLSPFFTSPMADYGYDVSDYCDVDPVFGTLDDFKALLARAHELGLKVVIDQVYAHSSEQHPWFLESRASRDNARADWYVWADARADGSPPSNWQSVFYGPAWTWDARRRQYYMHNFLPEQPQLNLHNDAVQEALLETAEFWLKLGVDGFRLDALNFGFHNPALTDNPPRDNPRAARPHEFQAHVNNMSQPELVPFVEKLRRLTDRYEARFTVAEVGGEDPTREMQLITSRNHRLNTAYNFDFLNCPEFTPAHVAKTMAGWPEGTWPSWAFSNHDAVRVVSRGAGARDPEGYARLKLLLLLCLRGNAFVYQGEELGLHHAEIPFERLLDPEAIRNWPETLCRDGSRTPMVWDEALPNAGFGQAEPWLPIDPRHPGQSVSAQEIGADSVLHFARQAIALRRNCLPLRCGDFTLLRADENILAFTRQYGAEKVLCVFNLGHDEAGFTVDGPLEPLASLGNPSPQEGRWPVLSAMIGRL